MQFAITDAAAIEFSQALYEAVAHGKPIETAVTEGRQAMIFASGRTVEWGVPMLYLRALDSTLFTVVPPDEDLGSLAAKLEAEAARKEWDAAIATGEGILRHSSLHASRPTTVKAYNSRGFVYYTQGKLNEAVGDYSRALELDPQSVLAYNGRGYMHYAQGKLDEALHDLNRALELDPQFVNSYNNRGLVYYAQDKLDEALHDLNRALELDPLHVYAYNNRGLVYKARNDSRRARADFERAAELGYEAAKKALQEL